jgi:hypothetical protein
MERTPVTPANRLRRQAAELLELANELDRSSAATLSSSDQVATQDDPSRSALLPLKEAAAELGVSYDAARIRASRQRATVKIGDNAFVWRHWLDEQIRNVRCVRSVAEHPHSER